MTKPRPRAPSLDADEAMRMLELFDNAVHRFSGQLDELESAIGMYVLGRHVGWKVLYLVHTKKTVAKYEAILGIKVREAFDEAGPESNRSLGFLAAQAFSNFWKVVSGAQKLDIAREERRTLK
ncbi:MAG: hypothetical protein KGL51_09720 [Betaproteobacteria bacterium]|nr:hypothetical protein [Betaproteobacteria bacterium]MDE2124293.1 hypothetical protein [Betaproteobacteria bacterium]MDE2187140.1 hypothetical protein [Betaproteobacteria bacterium]MDE2324931.1 hypothetical protein [Betaproteobacteria bacterium]